MLRNVNEKSDGYNDADLMFFRSLLPALRKLNDMEKLEYRIEVNKLTKGFLERVERTRNNPTEVTHTVHVSAGVDVSNLL